MMSSTFNLELFEASKHERSTFDCNEPSLNQYLKQYAKQDIQRDLTRMHVIVKQNDPTKKIYGYFTINTYSVGHEELPDNESQGLPRYSLIPAILIGRLAKDINQAEINGSDILASALQKAKNISKEIGAKFVVVDCLNETAKAFYIKNGFVELKSSGMKLVMVINTIP